MDESLVVVARVVGGSDWYSGSTLSGSVWDDVVVIRVTGKRRQFILCS
jgi:hypothetical protein